MKAVRKTFTPFWYTRIKRGRHPIKAKWVINLPGFVVFIGSQSHDVGRRNTCVTSRAHDEIMDLGELDYHGDRAWVAECSCGWVFGHGVGITAWRNRESARLRWREHAKSQSGWTP